MMKHHVNAITEDDFWQVVKEEMLQEGDFEVESLIVSAGHIGVDRHQPPSIARHTPIRIDRQKYQSIDRQRLRSQPRLAMP